MGVLRGRRRWGGAGRCWGQGRVAKYVFSGPKFPLSHQEGKGREVSYRFRTCDDLACLQSRSPKAGHPKAGRSDFRNQRFETDTGKMRKMRKVPLTPQKQWSEEIPQSKNAENAENAENADTKTRKMRKMRKVPLTPQKQGSEEIPQSQQRGKRGKCGKCGHENAENAENADDWL